LNFAHTFCHTCKTHGYGLLFYNVLLLCVWNFGILNESCLKNKKSIEWMECDSNLLCYGLFKIPKLLIIFKTLLIIKKIYLKKIVIFFICIITSWFEIGNGKKC
jgi:hypothetical protein